MSEDTFPSTLPIPTIHITGVSNDTATADKHERSDQDRWDTNRAGLSKLVDGAIRNPEAVSTTMDLTYMHDAVERMTTLYNQQRDLEVRNIEIAPLSYTYLATKDQSGCGYLLKNQATRLVNLLMATHETVSWKNQSKDFSSVMEIRSEMEETWTQFEASYKEMRRKACDTNNSADKPGDDVDVVPSERQSGLQTNETADTNEYDSEDGWSSI